MRPCDFSVGPGEWQVPPMLLKRCVRLSRLSSFRKGKFCAFLNSRQEIRQGCVNVLLARKWHRFSREGFRLFCAVTYLHTFGFSFFSLMKFRKSLMNSVGFWKRSQTGRFLSKEAYSKLMLHVLRPARGVNHYDSQSRRSALYFSNIYQNFINASFQVGNWPPRPAVAQT